MWAFGARFLDRWAGRSVICSEAPSSRSSEAIAAALLVGGQNFSDPKVVVMVVVVAIVGLLILMPLSRMVANRSSEPKV